MSRRDEEKCNICGYPKLIPYTEIDPETGKQTTEYHEVKCLGHVGVKSEYWNKAAGHTMGRVRTLGYSDFQNDEPIKRPKYEKPKRKQSSNRKSRKVKKESSK